MLHDRVRLQVTSSNYVLTTALQAEWLSRALKHEVELPDA